MQMEKLSIEQQQTILDTLWVVNSVLKKQKRVYDEDLRQTAIIYLCKCLMRFNGEFGAKWNTYAYKSVDLYVRREIERLNKIKSREVVSSKEYIIYERVNGKRALYCDIKENCLPRTQKVLELKLEGYSDKEVRNILKCGSNTLCEMKEEIKKVAKEVRDERTNSLYQS